MYRPLTLALAAVALAQDPAALFEKAPPDIDEALRARVTQFYQYHVEGKFRAADALVAEDSKDAFFGMDKPRCRVFALGAVKYSENFTRAQVMISCDTEMLMLTGPMPVKRPLSSRWKLEDGQWFWYVEPPKAEQTVTPFGVRKPQPAGPSAAQQDLLGRFVDMNAVTSGVKADHTQFEFDPGAVSSGQVKITNSLPGSVTLSIEGGGVAGLTFQLDRTELAGGQSAVLSLRYQPAEGRKPSPATIRIVVSPTGQEIPVQVSFGAQAARRQG